MQQDFKLMKCRYWQGISSTMPQKSQTSTTDKMSRCLSWLWLLSLLCKYSSKYFKESI